MRPPSLSRSQERLANGVVCLAVARRSFPPPNLRTTIHFSASHRSSNNIPTPNAQDGSAGRACVSLEDWTSRELRERMILVSWHMGEKPVLLLLRAASSRGTRPGRRHRGACARAPCRGPVSELANPGLAILYSRGGGGEGRATTGRWHVAAPRRKTCTSFGRGYPRKALVRSWIGAR